MFISYWKIALRNLRINRLYSGISVAGLALGLAAFLLIGLFVREETRHDDYHAKAERLYRITRDILTPGGDLDRRLSTNSPQVAPLLLEDFPEVEQAARLLPASARISVGEVVYAEDYIDFADAALFSMFDFEWLRGDPRTALAQPDSVVLTESSARKFFGSVEVLGQTLELEEQILLTVTGVIGDLPNHTHMVASMFVSMNVVTSFYDESALSNWSNGNFNTYVLLAPGADISALTSGFDAFLARHLGADASRARLLAMNVRDIRLHWRGGGMKRSSSVAANFYYFLAGLSILLIACCNYTNLALAASLRRIREIGIRKSMGASRRQLIVQHVGEACVVVTAAMIVALVLVELLLPAFNVFLLEELRFAPFRDPPLRLALLLIVVVVTFLSSIYPAFYLSRLQAGTVIAQSAVTQSNKPLSKGLIVLQFALAIFFVVTAVVMAMQMQNMRHRDMGFEPEGLLRVNNSMRENLRERWPDFKRALLAHPGISNVSGASAAAFRGLGTGSRVRIEGEELGLFPHVAIDEDFFATHDIPLVAGRLFTADGRDSGAQGASVYILNEKAARRFGWTAQQAIGQVLESGLNGNYTQGTVIGVVADAEFESLHGEQRPVLYQPLDASNYTDNMRHIAIRLNAGSVTETLAFIDATWNQFMPAVPIQRRFVEEDLDNMYLLELKLGQFFVVISALTVAIACMGLFGLAAFNTESRIKEIGVRKVLGGSVWNIVLLVASQFSRLVLVANLLAWPLAWYAMTLWLRQYAVKISLTPFIFIGSGAIALCIAWVTVGGVAAKAAARRPVLALRYE